MMKETLQNSSSNYLLLNKTGTLLYSTLQGDFLQNIQAQLKKEFPSCLTKEKRSFFITVTNKLYAISAHLIENAPEPYLIFYITPSKLPINHSK